MSYQIVNDYTDTAISGVASLSFPRGLLNFAKDFRVQSDAKGETVLTNITSPLDRPENIRYAFSEIANVYNNTSIDSSVYAPSKRGVSVLAQVTDILSYQDASDASKTRIDLPLSAHLVIKAPASEYVTPAAIQTLLGRLISSLYETGSLDTTRLASLMRGSLTPSDL